MKKTFELKGHILDSLILSAKRKDFSVAKFIIETDDNEKMDKAVQTAKIQGAEEV